MVTKRNFLFFGSKNFSNDFGPCAKVWKSKKFEVKVAKLKQKIRERDNIQEICNFEAAEL